MLQATSQRSVARVIRVALVFLAAAVFAWGLQAKLALYKAPSPTRNVSVAKLLQHKQGSLQSTGDHQGAPNKVAALASGLLLAGLHPLRVLSTPGGQRAGKPARPPLHLSVVPSLFRPPPTQ